MKDKFKKFKTFFTKFIDGFFYSYAFSMFLIPQKSKEFLKYLCLYVSYT